MLRQVFLVKLRNEVRTNTAGTVGIQACGVPSDCIITAYGVVVSHSSMKQESQLYLAVE